MLTETFRALIAGTRKAFGNWRSLLLIAVVYGALLALIYLFVAIREATFAQVTLTFAFAVAAPLLFFVLQAMIMSGSASEPDQVRPGFVLKKSLASFWKLILISLPLIALAILIAYLLGKAQNRFGQAPEALNNIPHSLAETANSQRAARPVDWRVALFSTLRYLSFGLVLPLLAIHIWLATVSEGLGGAVKKIASLLSRAFSAQSVLIYIVGFLVFAVVPYFLLFKTTKTGHAWLELFLLVVRLAVVFALTLFGWVITVRALGLSNSTPPAQPATEAA
ncbi:MAG TPA: hypothetical protein VGO56_00575 [Pyrinomonadaceae bacterium]|jgi:hypothetical protein|nr:hypothetical protein [Pyrinomonadaceae bacterium]